MKRGGFTLIELLIFLAIFSVVIIAFTTIFLSILRVYSRQSSSAEVNRQTQVVLQTIQRYVERSSLVDMPAGESTSTIKLRMPEAAIDPAYIYVSNGTVYLKETDAGTPQALTNSRVSVLNVAFSKRNNSPGRDSVDINFTMEFSTENIEKRFLQSMDTAVARVSAATFDSDLVASSSNNLYLGTSPGNWRSINSTVWFSNSNVGIAPALITPTARFQVNSGDVYVDTVGNGVIIKSNNGTCWRVRVTDAGAFTSASITCP